MRPLAGRSDERRRLAARPARPAPRRGIGPADGRAGVDLRGGGRFHRGDGVLLGARAGPLMAGDFKLMIDGAARADILHAPAVIVGRMLIERSTRVQMAAKAQAPRRTGCLQGSIVKRAESLGDELAIRIQSDTTSG